MSKNIDSTKKPKSTKKRSIIITLFGAIIMLLIIVATLEISHRNINSFISTQQRYIISIESIILVAFIVEMLARITTLLPRAPQMIEYGTRLRLIIRVVGYSIGSLSVISIISSNPTLGISVGAIAGVVIAFATQNITSSMLATVLLLGTRMVRVGEEITINQVKGIVSDINLTHTVMSIDDDVVFIPNSLIVSSMVRRKKRYSDKDASIHDW
jgi:small-conductance mechanosensitive channel